MEAIIKTGLNRVTNRHSRAIPKLQKIVDSLIEAGFTISTDSITDLCQGGSELRKQARQMAEKSTEHIPVNPIRLQKAEIMDQQIGCLISEAASDTAKILMLGTMSQMRNDAFAINDRKVAISDEWLKVIQAEYTIQPTANRARAIVLMENAKRSIAELNDFVKDNPCLASGLTRRSGYNALLLINDRDDIIELRENLEYID